MPEDPHPERTPDTIETLSPELRQQSGGFAPSRVVGAIAMAIICAISAANVVVRYATDASFAFTEEYSVFLLVVMTFAGTAAAARTDGHIRILAFARLFGRRLQRAMLVLSTTATLAMFLLITWYGGRLAYEQFRYGDVTAGLGNPAWIYSAVMPVLCVPILIRVVVAFVAKWRKGEA